MMLKASVGFSANAHSMLTVPKNEMISLLDMGSVMHAAPID